MDEHALIKKAQEEGDIESFGELVSLYEKKVYNLALRISGSREDAFDIAQETFLKAFKNLPKFKGESSFSTWIYRIASNTAYDFLRYDKPKRSLDDEENPIEIVDPSDRPEQKAEQREKLQTIAQTLHKLPLEQRQVVVLRDVEGYSYDEIAQILKLELGTVKSRISRARQQFKKLLDERNFFKDSPSKSTKGGEPQ